MPRLFSLRSADNASPEAGTNGRQAWRKAWQAFIAQAVERRRLRRAECELLSLDDRVLEDIGVSRDDIAEVVRYGRGPPIL